MGLHAKARLANLVLHNAKVITMDGRSTIAQAVGVRGDEICAVGSNEEVLALADEACRVLDLEGRTVMPGFIDGHAHMDREGLKGIFPSLRKVSSIADIQAALAELVKKTPVGEWIVTMPLGEPPAYVGMPQTLAEGRFPTRQELDAVAPDHPVYIRAIWGYWRHTTPLISIANSKALELAGIGPDTIAPSPLVTIEKDSEGIPTGVFREDTLMPIVELTYFREAARFPVDLRIQSVPRSIQAYHAYGTTSVYEGHGVAAEVLQSYKAAYAAGELDMRVGLVLSPNWKSANVGDLDAFIGAWCGWLSGRGLGDDRLRMAGIFVDMGRTSDNDLRAQAYPNTGWAGFNYDTAHEREKVLELLLACARHGIQVVAIWPNMLDLFYETHQRVSLKGLRWVLGHVSVLSPQDIEKVTEMGLIVTTHTNRYLYKEGHLLMAKQGADKVNDIVPLRSLLDAGVPVVLATDNVPITMFHPIWQVIAREARDAGQVVAPAQKLSREEALRCATVNGALLTWDEARKGSLEVGKLADMAILDADPLSCPVEEIKDIEAVMTIIGGRIVYEAPSASMR